MENKNNNKKRVLIVEDDENTRVAISFKLEKEGQSVDYAVTGEEALNKLKTGNYHLLLLDLRIPGKDGITVLEELQESGAGKSMKIVVFTNMGASSLAEKALSLGAEKVFLKANTSIEEITNYCL